ncbi:MAG TPA: SDR family oxidoreductase [Nevskiaceae bacterium]|nr:SDR family oxidoreductase [Nevskiaceae bacterium]
MDFDFPRGAVLMFGASGGIGQGVARYFGACGADVALVYRKKKDVAEAVAQSVWDSGRRATVHCVDVSDRTALTALVGDVMAEYGRIHTVVWAVGPVAEQVLMGDATPDQWNRAIDVETKGFFNVVQATLPHLREHGGSYVHLGSAGQTLFPIRDGLSVVPKAANEALCRAIAREEGVHGVRANSILLGVIDAGMFHELTQRGVFDEKWVKETHRMLALKRWGQPEEVGHAAVFLATNGYVTGQQISVSGGFGV